MKIICCKNEEAVGKAAGVLTLSAMMKPNAHISITGGSSPRKMYDYMIPMVKDNPMYQTTQFYNFDEIPQNGSAEGLTMQALRQLFFDPAAIEENNIHILNEHSYQACEQELKDVGYLDYIIIGLGKDGHFCGNLPGTCSFHDETHAVRCDLNQTLYDRIKFLSGGEESKIPEYYVTMGPKTVMQSKKVVMIVTGEEKAEIVKKVFFEPVNEGIPSSIFQLHPDFTLIIDEKAAALFPKG